MSLRTRKPTGKPECSVSQCARESSRRGWCENHYRRWRRHGNPEAGHDRYATPEEAFIARTERRGDCLIWTGTTTDDGYGVITADGQNVLVHRWVWEQENGPIPEGVTLDHTCWARACADRAHLRLATHTENVRSLSGARIDSGTGVRNVSKQGDRYYVSLRVDGKLRRFGGYPTLEEAATAAEHARLETFGAFAGKG